MALNNNKLKKRPNWIENQIQILGPNFLEKITSADIKRESRTIFKDLSKGNIDAYKYAQYLLHPALSEVLFTESQAKNNYYSIISMAMDNYITACMNYQSINPDQLQQFSRVRDEVKCKCALYGMISNAISSASYQNDPSYYITMVSMTQKYAYLLD